MKLYIDGLFYKSSGIGRYYANLLKGLSGEFEIVTSVPLKYKNQFENEFKNYNITPVFVNYDKFSFENLFQHHKILNNLKDVEIFFFPQINVPLFFNHPNIVVTVHDFIPYTEFWDRSFLKKTFIKFLYLNAVRKASRIVTVSNATKKDLHKYFNKKSEVIYNFVDDEFFVQTPERIINEPYILYLGNRKKHKNLKNLILAYDGIKNRISQKLVIAGTKDSQNDFIDELIDKLGLKNKIIEINSPSDKEIYSLYKYTDLFVFPSFYEGFGYPPLEALALGSVAVSSNIPILKEILGEKIACFDPYDVSEIGECMLNILQNENLKKELYEEGKKRLSKFRREKIIPQYIELIKALKNENIAAG